LIWEWYALSPFVDPNGLRPDEHSRRVTVEGLDRPKKIVSTANVVAGSPLEVLAG
jgi:hypothetical protein